MKYQKKQQMKRKVFAIIALAMAVIMILSLVAPFIAFGAPVTAERAEVKAVDSPQTTETKADAEYQAALQAGFGEELFSVALTAGYDGSYVVGKSMPIRGLITSRGQAFHGEIQVKAYVRDTSDNKDYVIYYQKLDLEQGASKRIDMDVRAGGIHSYVEIALVDENGQTLYKSPLPLQAKDPKTIMVGILSEARQDLSYLSNMEIAQMADEGLFTHNALSRSYDFPFFLDEETFPKSSGLLSGFSALVVDDFDLSLLSERQREALGDWLVCGGVMLVGTGTAGYKTWQGLEEMTGVTMEGTTAAQGILPSIPEVTLANLTGAGLTTVQQVNEMPLFSQLACGEGKIVVCHFSLSQAPMAGQTQTLEMVEETLQQALGTAALVQEGDNYSYDRLRYITQSFPVFEMGSVYVILGSIVVYILLAGPILYIILKKKDKREKGWAIIPALSLVFMGVVFLLAKNSTYQDGIINKVAFVQMQDDSSFAEAEIGIAFKSSDKGDVLFTANQPLTITQNVEEYYYRSEGAQETCLYRVSAGDTTEVLYEDSTSWQTRYFKSRSAVDMGGTVESTIVTEGDRFVGEIINNTTFDFYRTSLILDGYHYTLEGLPAGESMQIDISRADMTQADRYGYGYEYQKIREMVQSGEITRADAYLREQENDLRNRYYDDSMSSDIIPVVFFGYSDADLLSGDLQINGRRALENNTAAFCKSFPLKLSEMASFTAQMQGQIESLEEYEAYEYQDHVSFYTYAQGEYQMVYTLPEQTSAHTLTFVQEDFDVQNGNTAMQIFDCNQEAWVSLQSNEAIPAADYVSDAGEIRLRMDCEAEREYVLPELNVEGGGLLAGN